MYYGILYRTYFVLFLKCLCSKYAYVDEYCMTKLEETHWTIEIKQLRKEHNIMWPHFTENLRLSNMNQIKNKVMRLFSTCVMCRNIPIRPLQQLSTPKFDNDYDR